MLIKTAIIKKLPNGKYRLYSRKKDSHGKRRNLGTYNSLSAVKQREKEISFFKHHAEDGMVEDNETKLLKNLSKISTYLEEAGFIDSSDTIYSSMGAIDGSLSDDEDYIVDMFINTDEQMNVGGAGGSPGVGGQYDGSAGSSPSLLSMDAPSLRGSILFGLVKIANDLDQKSLYEEADAIDDLLKIITELEDTQETKKTQRTKEPKEDKKDAVDTVARSNGRDGTSVTDNSNSGMFQGLSDAYFYRGYGNLEGAYGPADK